MTTLTQALQKNFPQEQILKRQMVDFTITSTTSNVRYPHESKHFPRPVEMIETNQKLYFDLRPFYKLPSFIDMGWFLAKMAIPGTIVLLLIGYWHIQDVENVVIGALVIGAIMYLIVLWAQWGFNNVWVYDKSWIKNQTNQNGYTVYEGEFSAPFESNLPRFIKPSSALSESEISGSFKSSFSLVKTYSPSTTKFSLSFKPASSGSSQTYWSENMEH